ncbi:YcjX family protein [Candidatus Parabeggiatoa sp. HSG14]|uniref:YcjX family protein n=1 Tax=Candidatus Parabeggiatoa sp. HSG14 TaxID=3055593 RepID=UPI0025A8948C|nr:YcjX family protein [Thiotrichales bacterium HSG14]
MKKWLPRFSSTSTPLNETVNRSLDKQVKLAVTGLSRSGKTVFITSLVHQLLHGLGTTTHLPFFQIASSGRLRGTKAMPQPDMHIPSFLYDSAIEQLCGDPPTWPKPTNGISEIRLAIRYLSDNPFFKHLSPISTLYVDIIDYPGEWLLDLPLLELEYEQWSEQIARACEIEPRLSLSKEWRIFLNNLNLADEADETVMRQAANLYTDFLHQCKQHGLSLLQPGRFTMPGDDLKDAPLLKFCPLLEIPQIPQNTYNENSLFAEMKKRYNSYKEHLVKKFYEEHFSSFDRQIILADVLSAFNNGHATFVDMRDAINMVLKSFHYGKSGLFNKLFGGLKIDKMLFATTKADHVTPDQLPHLETFFQNMLATSHNNAIFEGVQTETLALAAVKCTQAAYTMFEGKKISCIKGVPLKSDKPVALFPGEVPPNVPMPEEWVKGRFHFVEFKPPRLANVHGGGLPHIRLDRALEFLLGDKF